MAPKNSVLTAEKKNFETTTNVVHAEIPSSPDMKRVGCLILGGGQGTRLFPLTHARSKPAIRFGGRYRLIDVPLSNAINSGCLKIFVVTQFLSSSLHRHIFKTYFPKAVTSGFIELLAAEQKPNQDTWYQGTADAIRQNLQYFIEAPVDYFFILSGDQLYHMNFQHMVRFAQKTDADMVVAALPVDGAGAKRMGVMKVDGQSRITDFVEKPQDPSTLESFRCPTHMLEHLGRTQLEEPHYLASMGIYLFKRQALINLLQQDSRDDFGKHLIPSIVGQGRASAFLYDGYWEDIGTIGSFYNANMALTRPEPFFNCYDEACPLYAHQHNLPPSKIMDTQVKHSIIGEGSVVEAKAIRNSILGPRSVVKHGTVIEGSYVMGNDFYTLPVPMEDRLSDTMQIGRDCVIKRAIIDTNVYIGDHVRLENVQGLDHFDGDGIYIRDGIIVVTRGAQLPDHYCL